MNILLTGSTGFIGSNIARKLVNKNKLFIIIRNKKKNSIFKHKNIKIINFSNYENLGKKLTKIKINTVVHAATHYVKNHDVKDLQKLANSNILLGNIILENLSNMKVKKFINFSTVWEDFNGIKNNFFNLYATYKKAFSLLIDYYEKKEKRIKFYKLMISDTFGSNDNRKKIINILKKNYKKNIPTKIVSKKLSMNLLNVEDIVDAVDLISKKNIKPGKYLINNHKNIKLYDLINVFNNTNKKKLKINWLSNKMLTEKNLAYDKLKSWKPLKSNILDIINIIKN